MLCYCHTVYFCSGPLNKTTVDFWRLIWQERPPTIVMVTNLKEDKKIKCQQYWPESGSQSYGPFQVSLADQQMFTDYIIRTLRVEVINKNPYSITEYSTIHSKSSLELTI